MNKYIDADILRKEIEFAKSVYSHPNRVTHGVADAFMQDGRAAMCDDILKKIDSLQREQPNTDIEKEIKSWIRNHVKGGDLEPYKTIKKAVIQWGEIVARHFYELGQQKAKEKR